MLSELQGVYSLVKNQRSIISSDSGVSGTEQTDVEMEGGTTGITEGTTGITEVTMMSSITIDL